MYSVLFHLITEQLLSRSALLLESWYIWLDRRPGGWGLEGEVRSSSNPPSGSALQLPQLEKGLDRLISGTVQLSQLGTQLLFLISVKIRCTPQMKQESLLNEKMYGWPRAGSAASNLSCFVDVNPICSARGASRFTGGVTNWYIAPLPGTFSLFERFIEIPVLLILLNYKHNLQKRPLWCSLIRHVFSVRSADTHSLNQCFSSAPLSCTYIMGVVLSLFCFLNKNSAALSCTYIITKMQF